MKVFSLKLCVVLLLFVNIYLYSDESNDSKDVQKLNGEIVASITGLKINLIAGNTKITGDLLTRNNKFQLNLSIGEESYTGGITQNVYGVFKKWFGYEFNLSKNGKDNIHGNIEQQYNKFSSIKYIAEFNLESKDIGLSGNIKSNGKINSYDFDYNNSFIKGSYNLDKHDYYLEIIDGNKKVGFIKGKFVSKINKDIFSFDVNNIQTDDLFIFILLYFYEKIESESAGKYDDESIYD